jgi:phage-related protein
MSPQPPWSVEFYTDARGEAPAMQFLEALPIEERAVAARALRLLADAGVGLGMPHVRPIEDLWELRAGPNRLFYVAHTGRRFIVLHGYRKQSQKAPRQEIATARRRLQDFLSRGG